MNGRLDFFGLIKILAFLAGVVGATIYVNDRISNLVDERIDARIDLRIKPLERNLKHLSCLLTLRTEDRTLCLQKSIGG